MFLEIMSIPEDVGIQKQLTSVRVDEWLREDALQLRWWLLLALLIIYSFVWWKAVDKARIHEILLYAALTTAAVMGIVEYGEELSLWEYTTDLLPVFPALTAIDLISLPFMFSLIYQRFRTWKSFILASIIAMAVFCFILEPLYALAGFYRLIKWKYYYSYPIFFSIMLFIRFAVIMIFSITKKSKCKI